MNAASVVVTCEVVGTLNHYKMVKKKFELCALRDGGASGQVKWLTDVVAGGKSNDWLMWWDGNALYLALVLALALALALSLALALTDDVVAVGKSNDWLMRWQGASQMTDWCGETVMLYI